MRSPLRISDISQDEGAQDEGLNTDEGLGSHMSQELNAETAEGLDKKSEEPDTETNQVMDVFHPFPRLPIELRFMIAKYSQTPRVLTLSRASKKDSVERSNKNRSFPARQHQEIPAWLHVNLESREEFKKSYQKLSCNQRILGTTFKVLDLYINPDFDIVRLQDFKDLNLVRMLKPAINRQQIQSISFDFPIFSLPDILRNLRLMPRIRQISIGGPQLKKSLERMQLDFDTMLEDWKALFLDRNGYIRMGEDEECCVGAGGSSTPQVVFEQTEGPWRLPSYPRPGPRPLVFW